MLRGCCFGLLAAFGIPLGAGADLPPDLIRSYNAAMASGESAAIIPAAKALAAAAVADPVSAEAGLVAFETAVQLCIRGDCASAVDAARLAATAKGADLPPAPERALLAAYANWSAAAGPATLAALDAALSAIEAEPPTLISVNAFGARYVAEAKSGSPATLSREARRAADHFRPGRDLIEQYWADAEMTALTTQFNTTSEPRTLLAMYDLEHWLDDQSEKFGDEQPEWLDKAYYKAMAWRIAIETFVEITDPKNLVLPRGRGKERDRAAELKARPAKADADLPFCAGGFEPMPAPRYPSAAERGGFFGSIIIGVEIIDGELGTPRVLAAVPSLVFEQVTLDSFKGVGWKFDAEQPKPCDRSMRRVVIPFVYEIE